jgi:uncharacterized protein YjbK
MARITNKSRVSQDEYNKLLDTFNAKNKRKRDNMNFLISQGFSYEQAKNAVHVYFKGSPTSASFTLSSEHRNQLLDDFDAKYKLPKDCVNHLMECECTYRQATSAVYQYRVEKGLIGE